MQVTSYGAAGEVTGSKHLIEVGGKRLLLDCGMFQGDHRTADKKNRELPFDANTIDAVILSHGHLDHCGSLPLLVRRGYRGPIYATPATKDVAECIMRDSAHIQLYDAEYHNRHRKKNEPAATPLYVDTDIDRVLALMKTVPYHKAINVLPNVSLTFYDAGHILGSAVIHLNLTEGNRSVPFAYTGDFGHKDMPILRNPDILPETEVVLSESTYGNRTHETLNDRTKKLVAIVRSTVKMGGKIIVPAFALGRMQTLIYSLHVLTDSGKIPRLPIYIDSPLGERLTRVFRKHTECYDEEAKRLFTSRHDDPFGFRNLNYVKSVEESKSLNAKPGPLIIIASSGMVEAGRVLHHLKNGLANPNNTVLVVGYMAAGTRGRKLIEGAKTISFYGDRVPVRASVVKINAYSAHADEAQLLHFYSSTVGLRRVFLVHGDAAVRADLAATIKKRFPKIETTLPIAGRTYQL
ncbi:MBL fold metallo-hydrolase [Candidatus Uhrbacteria bacterium CG10_big_fil_rev_8_21_14_0_10_48_11]|uniref:MBL fold metallo-hydrolase n=1 Tax=Candidatus Uhrbacteria bacterium CG10_big_fil_rev_8_21_14_0_10_48_11 TaxID=1975037 RepID=A0A2M8LFJ4_9BACT|nr:MAG: MBL fold metallo-hydrolase [Candidatus Uhrbacteria bacterium CG10_big_fil_rev_8_21_14_0_10_48_11]